MNAVGVMAFYSMLAFLVEAFTEYVFAGLGEKKKYMALGLGVLLAIAFQRNIVYDVFGSMLIIGPKVFEQIAWWAGVVLTGMIFGRGANFLHDLASNYFPASLNFKEIPYIKRGSMEE